MYIVSKITVSKGYAYFCSSDKGDTKEVCFFVSDKDIDPHECNYWNNYILSPLKRGKELQMLQNHLTLHNEAALGDVERNLLVLKDLKKVKEEMSNVLRWIFCHVDRIEFYPCDLKRHKATVLLLKRSSFIVKEHFFKGGDSVINVYKENEVC